MSRGRLKPEDEKCIQQNYIYLLEQLDARDIVNFLFQHEVIDLDDKMCISSQAKRKDRNEILLDRLLNAGPGYSFNYFLKSLEGNYGFILDKLRKHVSLEEQLEGKTAENEELRREQAQLMESLKDKESLIHSLTLDSVYKRSVLEKIKHQEINVFLLGPAGDGKSAVGNSILQRHLFESYNDHYTCTETFSKETVEIQGRRVTVFDEPPLTNHFGHGYKNFLHCIKETFTANPQGFNAILYVVNSYRRFTREDLTCWKWHQAVFGENSLKDFCVTVFTYKDHHTHTDFEHLKRNVEPFMRVISNRVVFFDNTTRNEADRNNQVASLLAEIDILQVKQQRLYTYQDFILQKKAHKNLLKEFDNRM